MRARRRKRGAASNHVTPLFAMLFTQVAMACLLLASAQARYLNLAANPELSAQPGEGKVLRDIAKSWSDMMEQYGRNRKALLFPDDLMQVMQRKSEDSVVRALGPTDQPEETPQPHPDGMEVLHFLEQELEQEVIDPYAIIGDVAEQQEQPNPFRRSKRHAHDHPAQSLPEVSIPASANGANGVAVDALPVSDVFEALNNKEFQVVIPSPGSGEDSLLQSDLPNARAQDAAADSDLRIARVQYPGPLSDSRRAWRHDSATHSDLHSAGMKDSATHSDLHGAGVQDSATHSDLHSAGVQDSATHSDLHSAGVKDSATHSDLHSAGVQDSATHSDLHSAGVKDSATHSDLHSAGVQDSATYSDLYSAGVQDSATHSDPHSAGIKDSATHSDLHSAGVQDSATHSDLHSAGIKESATYSDLHSAGVQDSATHSDPYSAGIQDSATHSDPKSAREHDSLPRSDPEKYEEVPPEKLTRLKTLVRPGVPVVHFVPISSVHPPQQENRKHDEPLLVDLFKAKAPVEDTNDKSENRTKITNVSSTAPRPSGHVKASRAETVSENLRAAPHATRQDRGKKKSSVNVHEENFPLAENNFAEFSEPHPSGKFHRRLPETNDEIVTDDDPLRSNVSAVEEPPIVLNAPPFVQDFISGDVRDEKERSPFFFSVEVDDGLFPPEKDSSLHVSHKPMIAEKDKPGKDLSEGSHHHDKSPPPSPRAEKTLTNHNPRNDTTITTGKVNKHSFSTKPSTDAKKPYDSSLRPSLTSENENSSPAERFKKVRDGKNRSAKNKARKGTDVSEESVTIPVDSTLREGNMAVLQEHRALHPNEDRNAESLDRQSAPRSVDQEVFQGAEHSVPTVVILKNHLPEHPESYGQHLSSEHMAMHLDEGFQSLHHGEEHQSYASPPCPHAQPVEYLSHTEQMHGMHVLEGAPSHSHRSPPHSASADQSESQHLHANPSEALSIGSVVHRSGAATRTIATYDNVEDTSINAGHRDLDGYAKKDPDPLVNKLLRSTTMSPQTSRDVSEHTGSSSQSNHPGLVHSVEFDGGNYLYVPGTEMRTPGATDALYPDPMRNSYSDPFLQGALPDSGGVRNEGHSTGQLSHPMTDSAGEDASNTARECTSTKSTSRAVEETNNKKTENESNQSLKTTKKRKKKKKKVLKLPFLTQTTTPAPWPRSLASLAPFMSMPDLADFVLPTPAPPPRRPPRRRTPFVLPPLPTLWDPNTLSRPTHIFENPSLPAMEPALMEPPPMEPSPIEMQRFDPPSYYQPEGFAPAYYFMPPPPQEMQMQWFGGNYQRRRRRSAPTQGNRDRHSLFLDVMRHLRQNADDQNENLSLPPGTPHSVPVSPAAAIPENMYNFSRGEEQDAMLPSQLNMQPVRSSNLHPARLQFPGKTPNFGNPNLQHIPVIHSSFAHRNPSGMTTGQEGGHYLEQGPMADSPKFAPTGKLNVPHSSDLSKKTEEGPEQMTSGSLKETSKESSMESIPTHFTTTMNVTHTSRIQPVPSHRKQSQDSSQLQEAGASLHALDAMPGPPVQGISHTPSSFSSQNLEKSEGKESGSTVLTSDPQEVLNGAKAQHGSLEKSQTGTVSVSRHVEYQQPALSHEEDSSKDIDSVLDLMKEQRGTSGSQATIFAHSVISQGTESTTAPEGKHQDALSRQPAISSLLLGSEEQEKEPSTSKSKKRILSQDVDKSKPEDEEQRAVTPQPPISSLTVSSQAQDTASLESMRPQSSLQGPTQPREDLHSHTEGSQSSLQGPTQPQEELHLHTEGSQSSLEGSTQPWSGQPSHTEGYQRPGQSLTLLKEEQVSRSEGSQPSLQGSTQPREAQPSHTEESQSSLQVSTQLREEQPSHTEGSQPSLQGPIQPLEEQPSHTEGSQSSLQGPTQPWSEQPSHTEGSQRAGQSLTLLKEEQVSRSEGSRPSLQGSTQPQGAQPSHTEGSQSSLQGPTQPWSEQPLHTEGSQRAGQSLALLKGEQVSRSEGSQLSLQDPTQRGEEQASHTEESQPSPQDPSQPWEEQPSHTEGSERLGQSPTLPVEEHASHKGSQRGELLKGESLTQAVDDLAPQPEEQHGEVAGRFEVSEKSHQPHGTNKPLRSSRPEEQQQSALVPQSAKFNLPESLTTLPSASNSEQNHNVFQSAINAREENARNSGSGELEKRHGHEEPRPTQFLEHQSQVSSAQDLLDMNTKAISENNSRELKLSHSDGRDKSPDGAASAKEIPAVEDLPDSRGKANRVSDSWLEINGDDSVRDHPTPLGAPQSAQGEGSLAEEYPQGVTPHLHGASPQVLQLTAGTAEPDNKADHEENSSSSIAVTSEKSLPPALQERVQDSLHDLPTVPPRLEPSGGGLAESPDKLSPILVEDWLSGAGQPPRKDRSCAQSENEKSDNKIQQPEPCEPEPGREVVDDLALPFSHLSLRHRGPPALPPALEEMLPRAKETDEERAEREHKAVQRMIQLVNVLGSLQSFVADRAKTIVKRLHRIVEDEESECRAAGG